MNHWLKIDNSPLEEYLNRDFELTEKGNIKSSATNLITAIVNPKFCQASKIFSGSVFYDTCSMSIKFLGKIKGENISKLTIRRWTDSMANLLGIEIEKEFGIKFSEKKMASVIRYIANKVAINLPALYIKSLEYDGEKHIEKLLPKYLRAKVNPLNNWIMEHMLVGMVKRIFEPGCKFDEIMVLTGEQGIGKTTFIEKLALMPDWYCSLNSIKGKDAISNLVGKIVVELEEFVALRNSKSADEAKLFISARTSTVRLPYERYSEDVDRTCILIATTNDGTFLGDFSGERRYLPVEVMKDNIQIPIMYDTEKFSQLEKISRKEHEKMIHDDFQGAVAEALYIYENNLHDFTLPKELRNDLNIVIQVHKNENRHVQNFYDFMEWKDTESTNPDILCSAEFTNQYPETNEKIFAELMINEMMDCWELVVTEKSKKHIIDGKVRVSKKFYHRKHNENSFKDDFVEITEEVPF